MKSFPKNALLSHLLLPLNHFTDETTGGMNDLIEITIRGGSPDSNPGLFRFRNPQTQAVSSKQPIIIITSTSGKGVN